MNRCTAAMPSLTYCMKAQRILALNSVQSTIVKLDSSITRKGCAYGIEFFCEYKKTVRSVLARAGISVSQYIDIGGGVPI